jgi:hypothetical protein
MRALRILPVLLLLSIFAFAADSPFTGTWKLNLEKSKVAAGDTTKSDVHHVVVKDESITDDQEWTDDKGTNQIKMDAKIDGKDYPVTGDPTTDMISYKHKGARTLVYTAKKAGKVVSTGSIDVSADGKTTTVKYKATTPEGKTETGTMVYDKE